MKKKKIVIGSIIGVVVIALIVTMVLTLNKEEPKE